MEQFAAIPMGDLWEDCCLVEPLLYLMRSKKLRTAYPQGCDHDALQDPF